MDTLESAVELIPNITEVIDQFIALARADSAPLERPLLK
jgi:hypothetical protein